MPAKDTIHIHPRYYRLFTDPGVDMAVENYSYDELDWDMPLTEAALVCLDVWNHTPWAAIDTQERADEIVESKIVPLVDTCRRSGLQVIHAPANPVAAKSPNWAKLIGEDEKRQPAYPNSPDWPPSEFRRKSGKYAKYARRTSRSRNRAFVSGKKIEISIRRCGLKATRPLSQTARSFIDSVLSGAFCTFSTWAFIPTPALSSGITASIRCSIAATTRSSSAIAPQVWSSTKLRMNYSAHAAKSRVSSSSRCIPLLQAKSSMDSLSGLRPEHLPKGLVMFDTVMIT